MVSIVFIDINQLNLIFYMIHVKERPIFNDARGI